MSARGLVCARCVGVLAPAPLVCWRAGGGGGGWSARGLVCGARQHANGARGAQAGHTSRLNRLFERDALGNFKASRLEPDAAAAEAAAAAAAAAEILVTEASGQAGPDRFLDAAARPAGYRQLQL